MLLNRRLVALALLTLVAGCTHHHPTDATPATAPGQALRRSGDEIVVCGQLFHTGGAPVVTWMDPGGYDGYRVERRFASYEDADWAASSKSVKDLTTPNRYGLRFAKTLSPEEIEEVRGGGWTLPMLREKVDQFVLHYDVCGTSRQCFNILHDHRDLSVHFMLDVDGTIYQTLDLKERAWHATTSNDRSIGIEIANIGAYPESASQVLDKWYRKDPQGKTRLVLPVEVGSGKWVRTPGFIGRPDRDEPIVGEVQNTKLKMYDLTPQQYASLTKLTATLCTVFPKIRCDYPRDDQGRLIPRRLSEEALGNYHGVLGHYHIQKDKTDPGPALQWDHLINGARSLMQQDKVAVGR